MFSKILPFNRSFQDLSYGTLYFNVVQIFKKLFFKEQFRFILFEVENFKKSFVRARTFTRTFDQGVVRRQNNDLKFCRRFFYYYAECFKTQLEKGKTCEFLIVKRKEKTDDFFISVEQQNEWVYYVINLVYHPWYIYEKMFSQFFFIPVYPPLIKYNFT